MVLWAANFIVVKSALVSLPPVGFTFLRFVIASITLMALLRWREGSVGLPRRDLAAPLFVLALAGIALLVVVMKALLRQAIRRETEAAALRSELDEVV